MGRRKIKDELDARACLAAVQAAGEDLVSWARTNGVDTRSLNAWRFNLERRRPGRRAQGGLVELVPTAPLHAEARYVLVLGEARLEFGDACSADTLRRVAQALRGC